MKIPQINPNKAACQPFQKLSFNRQLTRINKISILIILEFSMPEHFPMKQLYRFYFCHILPTIGGWISGNKGAYTYLPESVMKFPQGETFLQIMRDCGFQHPVRRKLSFGIASLYVGEK